MHLIPHLNYCSFKKKHKKPECLIFVIVWPTVSQMLPESEVGTCVCLSVTRNAALACSALSMPSVLNFPCCKLLCIRLTALLTPRWMSWSVVAGKPCRSLLYNTSLTGGERERPGAGEEAHTCMRRGKA